MGRKKQPSRLSSSPPAFPDLNFRGFFLKTKEKRKRLSKANAPPHFTLHKTSLKSKMVADTRVVVILGARTGQGQGSGVP